MLKLFSSNYSEILRPETLIGYGSSVKISPNGQTIVVIDAEKSITYFYDKHRDGVFYLTTQLFNYYYKNQNTLGRRIEFNATNDICVISTDNSNFIDFETSVSENLFKSSCVLFFRSGDNQIPKLLENGDLIYEDVFMWQHLVSLNNHERELVNDICFMDDASKTLYLSTIKNENNVNTNIKLYKYNLLPVYNAIAEKQTEDITLVNHLSNTIGNGSESKINKLQMVNINNVLCKFLLTKSNPKQLKYDLTNTINYTWSLKTFDEDIIDFSFTSTKIGILTQSKVYIYLVGQFQNGTPEIINLTNDSLINLSNIEISTETIIITSKVENKVYIYQRLDNLWELEDTLSSTNQLDYKLSFGYKISLSAKGDELLISEPYKNICWRYFYEPKSLDWLRQKIETTGFSNNYIVDEKDNTIAISNSDERTLDIYENVREELTYDLEKVDEFRYRLLIQSNQLIKYWMNELGNTFYFIFGSITNRFLGAIFCSNDRKFSDLQNKVYFQLIKSKGPIESTEDGDLIFTDIGLYKKLSKYNQQKNLIYSKLNFGNDNYPTLPEFIKPNHKGNLLYGKSQSKHVIYNYLDELKISNLSTDRTLRYNSTLGSLDPNNLIQADVEYIYDLISEPEIYDLDIPSNCRFITFNENNDIYFFESNKIYELKSKDDYSYKYIYEIELSDYQTSEFIGDQDLFIFYQMNGNPKIFYLNKELHEIKQYILDLVNLVNLDGAIKYKFTSNYMFRYSTSNKKVEQYKITFEDDISTNDLNSITKKIILEKKNEFNLNENIKDVYITKRNDLIIISEQKLYTYPNQNEDGKKKLVHLKRFYETKADNDLKDINKQFYYNVNRILGSKFISNYADKYKENNTYVVDEFECFLVQEFSKQDGVEGEYVINNNKPLFFRDDNINKYINTGKYRTLKELLEYTEAQNRRSKVFKVTTTNYLKGETFIRNGVAPVGRIIGVAAAFLIAYIVIFGPLFVFLILPTAFIVLVVFLSIEMAKYDEVKNSGAFIASVYDSKGAKVDESRFFKYYNDDPCSLVVPPDDSDDSVRIGGDGWKFRNSTGNNPAFYYDPVTQSYLQANQPIPYTQLLSRDMISKIVVREEPDLLNEDVNPHPIIRDFYSPHTFRHTKIYFVTRVNIKVLKRLNYSESNFIDKSNTIFGKKMDMTSDGEHIVLNSDLNTLTNTELKNDSANFYKSNTYTFAEGEYFDDTFTSRQTAIRSYTININELKNLPGYLSDGVALNTFTNLDGSYSTINEILNNINNINQESLTNNNEKLIDVSYDTYYSTDLNFYGGIGWMNWGEVYINGLKHIETHLTGIWKVDWYYVGSNNGLFPKSKIRNSPARLLSSNSPDLNSISVWYVPRFSTSPYGSNVGSYPNWGIYSSGGTMYPSIELAGYSLRVEVTVIMKLKFTDNFLKKYLQKLLRFSLFNFYDRINLDWIQNKSIVFNSSKADFTPKSFSDTDSFLKLDTIQKVITSADLLNENPFDKVFLLRDGLILGYKNKSYVCIDKYSIQPEINVTFHSTYLRYSNIRAPVYKLNKINNYLLINYIGNDYYTSMRFYKIDNLNNIGYGNVSYELERFDFNYTGFFNDGYNMIRYGKKIAWDSLNSFNDFTKVSGFNSITSSIYDQEKDLQFNEGGNKVPASPSIIATINNPLNLSFDIKDMCCSRNRDYYVGACTKGLVCVSTNLINWSLIYLPNSFITASETVYYDLDCCIYFSNQFIVGGESRIYSLLDSNRSSNLWIQEKLDQDINSGLESTFSIFCFAASKTRIVAVGASGLILYKTLGQTRWKKITLSEVFNNINSIIFDGYNFICVGDGGLILTSNDAITWVQVNPNIIPNSRPLGFITKNFEQIMFYNDSDNKIKYILLTFIREERDFTSADPSTKRKYYTIYYINQLVSSNQYINDIIKSSKNKNEYLLVRNNILSIVSTNDQHLLVENNRYKIQDEIGKLVLDDHIYNCLPDKGIVRKYERAVTSDQITKGMQLYQDDGYLYFGSNITVFEDYHIIDTDQGQIVIRNKNDPNITSIISTSDNPIDFGSNIIARENIYINDPKNNRLFILSSIPYKNIS